jgi:GNAT superfamily N-acetyltransferase
MNISYRTATPDDTAACIKLRGQTRENAFSLAQLQAIGVTPESWRGGIADGSFPGWLALAGGQIVGYCFGDRTSGEIVVLALRPAFENQGIGKQLLARSVADFRRLGFTRLFLGCSADPRKRSHGFYRHLGWRATGQRDAANDEVLEYLFD